MKPRAKPPTLTKRKTLACNWNLHVSISDICGTCTFTICPYIIHFLSLFSKQAFTSQALIYLHSLFFLTSQPLAVFICQSNTGKSFPCVPWQPDAVAVHAVSSKSSVLWMPSDPWPIPCSTQHGLTEEMVSNGMQCLLIFLCLSPCGSWIRPGNRLKQLVWL